MGRRRLGNTFETYAAVKAQYGNYQLLDAQIVVDGGWNQSGGTQQVKITNWELNGTTFFGS